MSRRLHLSVGLLSLSVALGAMTGTPAFAVMSSACAPAAMWKGGTVAVYSVKFTCGEQKGSDDDVVTGIYRTNVNIHNPSDQTVNFCTKVVLPDNANPTGISTLEPQSLGPDHSLFIDCYTSEPASIASQLSASSITAPTTEFEGFVVIEVPQGSTSGGYVSQSGRQTVLDVEGKYTARGGGESASDPTDVNSLQIVTFTPTIQSK